MFFATHHLHAFINERVMVSHDAVPRVKMNAFLFLPNLTICEVSEAYYFKLLPHF